MTNTRDETVNVKMLKTIGQFKKGDTVEMRSALARYWKNYVEIVDEPKTTEKKSKGKPKKSQNKAILDNDNTK